MAALLDRQLSQDLIFHNATLPNCTISKSVSAPCTMPPLTRAGRARMGSQAPPQPQSLFERSSPPAAPSPVPSSPLSSPLSSPPSSPEQPEHMTVRSPSPLPTGSGRSRGSSTPHSRSPSPLSSHGSTQVLSPLPSEAGSSPADGGQAVSARGSAWRRHDPIPRPIYQSPDTPPRERNVRQYWRQDPVPLYLPEESFQDQNRQGGSSSYPPTSPRRESAHLPMAAPARPTTSAPTDQPIGTLSVAVQTHRDQAVRDIRLRFYNKWIDIPDESTLVIDLKKHDRPPVTNQRASTNDLILWAGANRHPPNANRAQESSGRPMDSQASGRHAYAPEREGEGVDVHLGLVRLYRDPPLRVRSAFRRAVWQFVTDWRLILLFLMLAIPYIVKTDGVHKMTSGMVRFYNVMTSPAYQPEKPAGITSIPMTSGQWNFYQQDREWFSLLHKNFQKS